MDDSDIICPYCGFGMDATGSHEDDDGTWECGECEQPFEVSVEYDPVYTVACAKGKHELTENEEHEDILFCIKCDYAERKK